MKNLFLFTKNIWNYGITIFFKIIYFEIFYTFKNLDFKSLRYEESQNDSYDLTKKNKNYNTPYIPTPYFFLKIIKNFFIQNNIKNILFIDIGCGYSRSQIFFNDFLSFFIGFDYNSKIINDLKKRKIKNTKFYHKNLREKKSIDLLIQKISEFNNDNEIVVFFSDSFDLQLLKEIIKKLDKRFKFYCILINLKNKDFYKKKQNYIFSRVFQNKKRNIYIAKY